VPRTIWTAVRFTTLGSGSRGNATLIEYGDFRLLVDSGFGLRELERRLDLLGVRPETIQAILLTHEHGDHARGVAALANRYDVTVWTTPGSWRALGAPDVRRLRLFSGHDGVVSLGPIQVLPYPVPHDAREPVQFVFECPGGRLGMLTDAGTVTPHIHSILTDCDALILECNHDPELLRRGPYPPSLQHRVGGPFGHLSNRQAASLLDQLPHTGLRQLCLAHISGKNNSADLVTSAIRSVSESLAARAWLALQDDPLPWLEL
jgi:phosphoribosyl 1,2-cyclic phosphodiesterase